MVGARTDFRSHKSVLKIYLNTKIEWTRYEEIFGLALSGCCAFFLPLHLVYSMVAERDGIGCLQPIHWKFLHLSPWASTQLFDTRFGWLELGVWRVGSQLCPATNGLASVLWWRLFLHDTIDPECAVLAEKPGTGGPCRIAFWWNSVIMVA